MYYPQRPARVARSVAYLMLRVSSRQHNRFTSMMQCTKCEKGSGSDFEIANCEVRSVNSHWILFAGNSFFFHRMRDWIEDAFARSPCKSAGLLVWYQ